MWLVYIKMLYDRSDIVKILIWAFFGYCFVTSVYSIYGWIGIICLVSFVGIFIFAFWYKVIRKDQLKNKKVKNGKRKK